MSVSFFQKVVRKFNKIRFAPIRVFCFHHVSAEYDSLRMWKSDWTQLDQFKETLLLLKKEYEFISLSEAYGHIKSDWFRKKNYAVLTSDDGYASLKCIIPWLEEQSIPLTLFLNAKYMDGKSLSPFYEEKAMGIDVILGDVVKGLYLTEDDINSLTNGNVEIASHGYEHYRATGMPLNEFEKDIQKNLNGIKTHQCFIPFHAYTWGEHNAETDMVLLKYNLIPVLIDGMKNYNDASMIHRELLDGMTL